MSSDFFVLSNFEYHYFQEKLQVNKIQEHDKQPKTTIDLKIRVCYSFWKSNNCKNWKKIGMSKYGHRLYFRFLLITVDIQKVPSTIFKKIYFLISLLPYTIFFIQILRFIVYFLLYLTVYEFPTYFLEGFTFFQYFESNMKFLLKCTWETRMKTPKWDF